MTRPEVHKDVSHRDPTRRTVVRGLAAALACSPMARIAPAFAADAPLRLIVGFAPGGPIDSGARAMAPLLSRELGRPVIVENKPGGQGVIAVQSLLGAPADGNTVYLQSASVISNVFIRDFKHDVRRDLQPVAPVWTVSYFLLANAALPARTAGELVRYAREDPKRLSYGAPTSSSMLIMETLKANAQFEAVQVPYKGSAPNAMALLAGDVQVTIDAISAYRQHVELGKLRPLLYTGAARHPGFPQVPTASEAGFPALAASLTGGLWARRGSPAESLKRLAASVGAIAAQPEFQRQVAQNGWGPVTGSAQDLLERTDREMRFWERAAAAIHYQPE
jgi:tripartite-type tricarboxylate transporter receptor subunit TctC